MLYAIVAMLVVIIDQAVKFWVANTIPFETGIIRLLPGIMSIVNIHNDGAAFSFLSGGNARIWFIAIAGVFTLLVIIALATNMISKPIGRWSAVFVAAGGIANCIDRILYGYVQDMFKLEFINFAVFNVADIFITVFCIVFILYVIFGTRDSGEDYDEDEDEPVEEPKKAPKRPVEAPARAAVEEPARRSNVSPVAERPRTGEPTRRIDPVRVPADGRDRTIVTSRKQRQAQFEQSFDEYTAARQQQQRQAAARAAARASAPEDPFAEWDRLNASRNSRLEKEAAELGASKVVPVKPVEAQPAPAKAPVRQSAVKEEEFSLDDILNEFR